MRSGISAVVSEIIIVSIAILILVGFTGWIWGFWKSNSTEKYESIYIYHDSYLDSKNNTIYLHIKTNIRPTTIIYKISLDNNINISNISINKIKGNVYIKNNKIYADVGSEFIIIININKHIPAGTHVSGKIYTENGFVYNFEVISK